jgi:hypothetical protein
VDDTLRVHVTDSLADLSHEEDAIAFRQGEIIGHDALEQFPAGNAVMVLLFFFLIRNGSDVTNRICV